jgi:type 1 glutamine amidotransferase
MISKGIDVFAKSNPASSDRAIAGAIRSVTCANDCLNRSRKLIVLHRFNMKTAIPFLPRICRALLKAASLVLLILVTTASAADSRPKRLLIVGQGPDGHPPTTHEFMAGAHVTAELLKSYNDIQATVVRADEPWTDGPKLIDNADGIVMWVTQGSQWMQTDAQRHAALKRLAARRGAIVALHWSVGAKDAKYIQGQLDLLGATRGGPQRKYLVLPTELKRVSPAHPILTGIGDVKVYDEIYYALDRVPGIQPLFTSHIEDKDEMAAWAWQRPDGGRSFGFVGLHFHANWQLPEYRRFVVQGVRWSLGLPIPAGGAKVDIDSKELELNGALPPLPGPDSEKPKKTTPAKQ